MKKFISSSGFKLWVAIWVIGILAVITTRLVFESSQEMRRDWAEYQKACGVNMTAPAIAECEKGRSIALVKINDTDKPK